MDFYTLLFGYIAIHTLSTLDGDKPWDDQWSPPVADDGTYLDLA